jgi:hypothetical protein
MQTGPKKKKKKKKNITKTAYITIVSGLCKWHCVAVVSKLVCDCRKFKSMAFG